MIFFMLKHYNSVASIGELQLLNKYCLCTIYDLCSLAKDIYFVTKTEL